MRQPKLSEPAIATNHNKQALLSFWYNVCVDCSENVRLVVQNPAVTKNIAFNYILADHDDQEVVLFNRGMLPAYYGILRMCCDQSPAFTRQLASHQNIQWAFKNLTPHASQYPRVRSHRRRPAGHRRRDFTRGPSCPAGGGGALQPDAALCGAAGRHAGGRGGGRQAVQEDHHRLLPEMSGRPLVLDHPHQVAARLRKLLPLGGLALNLRDARSSASGDVRFSAFRVLLENDEDRLLVVLNRGLVLMTEVREGRGGKALRGGRATHAGVLSVCPPAAQSFGTLHMMYHEATACHVTGDLVELLSIFLSVLKATRPYLQRKGKPPPPTRPAPRSFA